MSDADQPDHEPDTLTTNMFGDAETEKTDSGSYLVLARKYRPQRFEDLIGQSAMIKTLENAFRTGRVAHAFMLTGVRGIGKTTTARLLARALNYETDAKNGPSIELDPPGRHCQAIIESRHPDVLELDAASRTGVDDMRELLDGARYTPVSARHKVFIIDEVHMLSKSAFNALLKTLEEPPGHVKFIFATTEIRKVPVTVLSRCQRFDLRRLTVEELSDHLGNVCAKEGAQVEKAGLDLIARAAEGSARDALSILDQAIVAGLEGEPATAEVIRDMLGLADRSRVIQLLELAVSGKQAEMIAELDSQLDAGAEPLTLFKDLTDLSVEMSRARALGDAYGTTGPTDWTASIQKLAETSSPAQISRYWQILLKGLEVAPIAPDPADALLMTLIQIASAASLPSPEDAVKMIIEASQSGKQSGPPPASGPDHSGSDVRATRQPSTFEGILALMGARKRADLQYELERFFRPANVRFGRIAGQFEPGAPHTLGSSMQTFLSTETDHNWQIVEEASQVETVQERKDREKAERIARAKTDPGLKRFLDAFPGAEVLDVTPPAPTEQQDDSVIHVDFAPPEARKDHG